MSDLLTLRVADQFLRERAQQAKDILKARLQRPEWGRGVGITKDANGNYAVAVQVRELTEEVRQAVPDSVHGVSVIVTAVGDIYAQSL